MYQIQSLILDTRMSRKVQSQTILAKCNFRYQIEPVIHGLVDYAARIAEGENPALERILGLILGKYKNVCNFAHGPFRTIPNHTLSG